MKPGKRHCHPHQGRSHSLRKLRPLCYVCHKSIRHQPVYVGHETFRHKRCKPGSRRYERFRTHPPEIRRQEGG
jgi:hypothetical protein